MLVRKPRKRVSLWRYTRRLLEKIQEVKKLLKDSPKLCWMFENCFPNTLETTARYRKVDGDDDTFVYTGDIPAMWLRDSGAQVLPYIRTEARYCSYQRVHTDTFLSLSAPPRPCHYRGAMMHGACMLSFSLC